jgi:hypothetical protein
MSGEALVDEGEVRVQKLQDAAVLPHDRIEEQLGLPEHGGPKRLVEVEEAAGVGRELLQGAGLQPLAGEVLRQGARARVAEHPPYLGG